MGTLVEDAAASAEWISGRLRSFGYAADFLPGSLWEVDRFVDENFRDGVPDTRRAKRRLAALIDPTGRLFGFALGAYVGEVIRRGLGGRWAGDDSDPTPEVSIELQLPTGVTITPVLRCVQRLARGPQDSIARFAKDLGLDVGTRPERPARRTVRSAHQRNSADTLAYRERPLSVHALPRSITTAP